MRIQPKDPKILKAQLKERPLVLFGAGSLGMKIEEYCDCNNISISCLVDNNATTKVKHQRKIVLPHEIREKYFDANIVISSNIFFDEIKQQLQRLGVPESQILSYQIFLPEEVTWLDLDSTAEWERMRIRVKKMAEWIDESISSVADYGAGEMYLKTLLPMTVKYFPIDYIKRTEETILCDLNKDLFPKISTDLAVLSGVLEFLKTAEKLIDHITTSTQKHIFLTYMTLDRFPAIEGRRASAYVNDFSEQQIIDMFAKDKFVLRDKLSDPAHSINTLFWFEKSKA